MGIKKLFNPGAGGVSGGITGATAGSAFGPPGMLIGGAIGSTLGFGSGLLANRKQKKLEKSCGPGGCGINGKNGNALTGWDPYTSQHSRLSPEQQRLQNSSISNLQKARQGKNFEFGPIEDEARKNFYTKTVPGISNRFTAGGGNSRLGSSSFSGALGAAGSELETSLAAQKQRYNLEQQKIHQQELNTLLSPSVENLHHEGDKGLGGKLLENLPEYAQLGANALKAYKEGKAGEAATAATAAKNANYNKYSKGSAALSALKGKQKSGFQQLATPTNTGGGFKPPVNTNPFNSFASSVNNIGSGKGAFRPPILPRSQGGQPTQIAGMQPSQYVKNLING